MFVFFSGLVPPHPVGRQGGRHQMFTDVRRPPNENDGMPGGRTWNLDSDDVTSEIFINLGFMVFFT